MSGLHPERNAVPDPQRDVRLAGTNMTASVSRGQGDIAGPRRARGPPMSAPSYPGLHRERLLLAALHSALRRQPAADELEQHDRRRRAALSDSMPPGIGIATRAVGACERAPATGRRLRCRSRRPTARAAARRRASLASRGDVATTSPPRARTLAPTRQVDVLEDRRAKCAPCPARSTFGDHANAQCFDSSTCSTPAAAAERSIVPTLPGILHVVEQQAESRAAQAALARGVATTASNADVGGQRRRLARTALPGTTRTLRGAHARGQRGDARVARALVDDEQRLGRADAVEVDADQVLAFEHALARLAPVARRRDEPAPLRRAADCRAR